jgi:hypothetical protein
MDAYSYSFYTDVLCGGNDKYFVNLWRQCAALFGADYGLRAWCFTECLMLSPRGKLAKLHKSTLLRYIGHLDMPHIDGLLMRSGYGCVLCDDPLALLN